VVELVKLLFQSLWLAAADLLDSGVPQPYRPFKVQNSCLWRRRGLVDASLWQLYFYEYFNPIIEQKRVFTGH
jgi:hypothetical protein